jgi:hypothetical protein
MGMYVLRDFQSFLASFPSPFGHDQKVIEEDEMNLKPFQPFIRLATDITTMQHLSVWIFETQVDLGIQLKH